MNHALILYHYWRSSSSWRVRWAFALKGISCQFVQVDLLNGEAEAPEHRARNPLGLVPVLEFATSASNGEPQRLSESMAIMEWAEETYPTPPLLPGDAIQRARIRRLGEIVNSEIQPLQNLNVLAAHSDDVEIRKIWARHWIHAGLAAYELTVKETAGRFSVGDELTMADICLIPQCYNARRFDIELAQYPIISRILEAAILTQSYQLSEPERFKP